MTTKAPRGADRRLPSAPSTLRGVRLTAPGAVLLVFVATVAGGLLDSLFGVGYGVLTGLSFATASVVAALKMRPSDLTILAVTPPLLFVAGVAVAETLRSLGTDSWFRNEVVAITAALAGDALWIVIGTGAVLVIALARLAGDRGRTRRQVGKTERRVNVHAHKPPPS